MNQDRIGSTGINKNNKCCHKECISRRTNSEIHYKFSTDTTIGVVKTYENHALCNNCLDARIHETYQLFLKKREQQRHRQKESSTQSSVKNSSQTISSEAPPLFLVPCWGRIFYRSCPPDLGMRRMVAAYNEDGDGNQIWWQYAAPSDIGKDDAVIADSSDAVSRMSTHE